MSNSPLATITRLSPNHSGKRTKAIERITPHCVVGQLSADAIAGCFASKSRQASCNYAIGKDGDIALVVDEGNRSWCTSSAANDQKAVTIEIASEKSAPYVMNDAAYNALVDLCVDICRRNEKKKLTWYGNKGAALAYVVSKDELLITVHRWYASKSCPGDWLYNRLGDLASEVTARLSGAVADGKAGSDLSQYKVYVKIRDLNIRQSPSNEGKVVGQTGVGTFTIVETRNNWGRLKSGAGWIYLGNPKYAEKL